MRKINSVIGFLLSLITYATLILSCGDSEITPVDGDSNTPSNVLAIDLGLPSGTKWANIPFWLYWRGLHLV